MIEIPWFPFELTPNPPKHWRVKMKAKEKYRNDCQTLAKAFWKKPIPEGKFHLLITFFPPSNRAYDLDNCLAATKNGLDGIALALGINDRCFQPITIQFGEVRKGGIIRVEAK